MKRESIIAGLASVLIAVVSFIVSALVIGGMAVDGFIPYQTASIVSKTIIEVSAALLGFWGIILVFFFSSINNSIDRSLGIYYEVLMRQDKMAIETSKTGSAAKKVKELLTTIGKSYEESLRLFEINISNQTKLLETTKFEGLLIAFMLVGSIMLAVRGLGASSELVSVNYLFPSLFLLILATNMMFLVLFQYKVEIRFVRLRTVEWPT